LDISAFAVLLSGILVRDEFALLRVYLGEKPFRKNRSGERRKPSMSLDFLKRILSDLSVRISD
jgi:hypothetical protein